MKYIKGDLVKLGLDGYFDVIVHGCNCHCIMGAGIARSIAKLIPGAYDADCSTTPGDSYKLGTYTSHKTESGLIVVNAYTQYTYGGDGVHIQYWALKDCLKSIKTDFHGLKIGLPMIGSGLAGGNWDIIEGIIAEELDGEDFSVVVYNGT